MSTTTRGTTFRVPTIDEIITSSQLVNVFQPIIDLQSDALHGTESLLRMTTGNPLLSPPFLFEYARRKRRTIDLELAAAAMALEQAGRMPSSLKLFLNTDPTVFEQSERWCRTIMELASRWLLDPARIVIEITEQSAMPRNGLGASCITSLRNAGVQFAFDDVGIAYSHLAWIDQIRPAYLKISQEFGTAFEADATKRKVVRNIAALARDFGCSVILEGIESAETAAAARGLGIRYGQGYLFGRPVPAGEILQSLRADA